MNSGKQSVRRISAVWLLLTSLYLPSYAYAEDEVILRLAFVYNIMKFITWPETDQQDTLKFCSPVSKGKPIAALQEFNGKRVNNLLIEVVYLRNDFSPSRLKHCDVIYLTESDKSHSQYTAIQRTLPEGVLLVADEADSNDLNTSIALNRNAGGRIEFSIDSVAVGQARVTVSSQLLKLAKNPGRGARK
jgi:hypothetical protein